MLPLVSVIVTTKNEEKHIANCLKSIVAQLYPKDRIEIIVVDNNSSDRTKEIVAVIAGEAKQSIQFFSKGPERSAQRNFGVEQSSGEYFLYLDADMILSPNVIAECIEKVTHSEIIGLYIPEIIMGEAFWCKVRRFERSFYNGTVIDCVRFVRKSAFVKVEGFDTSMTGPEDWDFDKKIRRLGSVGIIDNVLYHNESEFNLKKYLEKKSYYTKSFDTYIAKWGRQDADVRRQFSFYYRFLGVFIEEGKWKKLFFDPFLMVGMIYLRIIIGWQFLRGSNNSSI